MTRRRKHLSQFLVIGLIGLCALAILAYFNRPGSQPVEASTPATAPSVATAKDQKPADKVLRTETPTALTQNPEKPAIAVQPPAAREPTTKPVAQNWDQLVPKDPAQPKLIALANVAPAQDPQKAIESGDFLSARAALNAMMLTGDASAKTKATLAELNKAIVFSTKRFPDDPFGGTYEVQNGDSLQKIAKAHSVTWELLGRLNDISDPRKLRAGRAIKIINGPFHAVVSKGTYTIDIWLGEPGSAEAMYVSTFRVGLGKDSSTPTGTWLVTQGGKQKNPKFWAQGDLAPMEADDPKNPLGEFWIALTGVDGAAEGRESYGIHGTIDPDSIGKQMSLGCIRLAAEDIALVYELLVDGKSKVYVRE